MVACYVRALLAVAVAPCVSGGGRVLSRSGHSRDPLWQASLAVVIPMTGSGTDAERLRQSLERWNDPDFAPCRAVGVATVSPSWVSGRSSRRLSGLDRAELGFGPRGGRAPRGFFERDIIF